ncbi:hypothetical protein FRC01_011270 [Tulasnella sp. 417]|nr:hypothetical protein FRC01_011270 [Tulasnella sp. 417]
MTASASPAVKALPIRLDSQVVKHFARTHQFQRLVVFGDSWSDNDPAYYRHTFSNGPVWPAVLSGALGISDKLIDKATDGATSDNAVVQGYTGAHSTIPVPSALDQITQHINQAPKSCNGSNYLYAILIGANDIVFDPSASPDSAIQAIMKGMRQLQDNIGASNFILGSYPDLTLIPFAKYYPASDQTALSAYSRNLADSLFSLSKNPPKGARIAYIDLYTLFPRIFANPERYGFSPGVVGLNCISGAFPSEGVPRTVCSDPWKRAERGSLFAFSNELAFILALAFSTSAAPLVVEGPPVELGGQVVQKIAGTGQFQRLVVFGDSFSDDALGISNKLDDKAVGGATSDNAAVQGYTGEYSTIPVPSALDQITQYINHTTTSYDRDGYLYAIVIGVNDIYFDPGASKFLLASYPDLARLPFAKSTPPSYQAALSAYSKELADSISSIAKNPPKGARIAYIDFYTLFSQILANPERYGFSPELVGKNCISGVEPGEGVPRTVCSDPDKRAFWDIYHPSAKLHKIIAAECVKVLAKVF